MRRNKAGLPGKKVMGFFVLSSSYVDGLWPGLEVVNLIIQNLDKPGVIGFIGSTLGNYQVNIANMHLSRQQKMIRQSLLFV
jgi:hypothetical protein